MKFIQATKLAIGLILCASLPAVWAQTGASFQNCQPGDLVKVQCDQPLVVLGKATLLEISSNTVTVCTASERFTLAKSAVTLVPLGSHQAPAASLTSSVTPIVPDHPAPAAVMPPASSISSIAPDATGNPALPPANLFQTMESVRASVIDPHKMEAYKEPKLVNGKWELVVDPNSKAGPAKYDKANTYYNQTTAGVMDGSVSQEELVQQAKKVLADCDQYAEERKNDPQYEKQIAALRDFVRRSEAGEKFNFQTGKP